MQDKKVKPKTAHWTLYQANVLTLGVAKDVAGAEVEFETARVPYLTRQFEEAVAAGTAPIVGIQEARTKGPDIRVTPRFICICGGATANRQLGCEAWFPRVVSYTDNKGKERELEVDVWVLQHRCCITAPLPCDVAAEVHHD